MTEVLLQQLNNSDIQWIRSAGRQEEVAADTILIQQRSQVDFLYIVLDGELAATISRNEESRMGRAFAALEDEQDLEEEIARFSSGEVLGEMAFLDINPSASTVKALENSVLLAVPRQELLEKLWQDLGFASRFYRAISILLLDRFQRLVKLYLRRKMWQIAPLQDVPMLFGELSDSDVDWMVERGHLEEIVADTTLIRAGLQVENLYVLLQGTMSVSVSEQKRNRISSVFAALEEDEETEESLGREIARISRGEIIGEIAFLDSNLSNSTFKALEDSLVLAIPRQQLLIKLQQDLTMAARFYRVVAILLSGRLQGLISRLGFGRSSYRLGQSLSQEVKYEDEIDLEVIDNITLGGARFDWMLKRLRVS
ncbi:MAG: cyclic nucleotide-binding domain-containing protein [Xenococcaceae cyanobacterium]